MAPPGGTSQFTFVKLLETIGLPAKPSLRGNTWVVDTSHCQGCTSQFTFINRKHHCRTCGGLFSNNCTQQKMFLRGQGDSPVRICEPCEKLEEAARFERHGHWESLKLTSKPEDEVLNQIPGNDRQESGQESNSNVVASMQRDSSSASVQIVNKISATMGWEKYIESCDGSASPEELRQQAFDEKKKSAEALRAFKRGKELERQADALEIHLRKERKKVLLSGNVAESRTKDGPSESGRRNKVTPPVNKSKDDLSNELKELGWSNMDLRDEDKRQAIWMNDDKQQKFSIQYEQEDGFNFDHLISAADDHILDINFEVTDEDMEDPEINAALQSLGGLKILRILKPLRTHIAAVDREALLSELQSLKRGALIHKWAGNVAEAMAQLKKAKLLERDLESVDSPEGNVANDRTTIHNQTADKSSKSFTKGGILERQLEEIENGSMPKAMPGTVGTGSPGRPEPSKVNAGKSNNPTQDRSQLEEQIKVEKVKAITLKRAVKQAEALVTLRKAKMLEKKLNYSPSK
ncbi:phosphoinositide-binding protein [Prunus dulcis]|uniref:Phosphoinositide-binding protein n=1 Tax=Prunus dulcis TaxID=3755 RepID=A0A4Y1R957_PRUDU|nr:phosphoinositide-binding protein [Prunus dulcis]